MSSNNRASLLAGLRTGGVRQPAQMMMPQTSAPNVTSFGHIDMPMTAAVNGSFNPIVPSQQQQTRAQVQQQQAFQMQMMQMEILRLQALQQAQQQYQIELIRQQQQQQPAANRQPMSAAPNVTSFPTRRVSQAEQLKTQLHLNGRGGQDEFQAPMTASLGGKFGGRLNPNASSFRMGGFSEDEELQGNYTTSTASNATMGMNGSTAVISGGTSLGMNVVNAAPAVSNTSPSKGDSSANWRRVGNNSPGAQRAPSVTVTPPPIERSSPPFGHFKMHRPEPLRFQAGVANAGAPLVIVDSSDGDFVDDDDASSTSSVKSEPTTPPSNDSVPTLTSRKEASKRLYEGLGMGRIPQTAGIEGFKQRSVTKDASAAGAALTSVGTTFSLGTTHAKTIASRVSSQPMRQPLGPPSGVDELGSKNFASRIRRKAIGGLGAMLDARANRREIEAY